MRWSAAAVAAFLWAKMEVCEGFVAAPPRRPTLQSAMSMNLVYRNVKTADMDAVASLCSEAFDGPFAWHQALAKQQSVKEYKAQLSDRLTNMVQRDAKHAMVVALDGSEVVGFLEVGMLPSPLANDDDDAIVTSAADATPPRSVWEEAAEESRVSRAEVPFLGNVAVAPSHRRQGIGARLVRVGMKVAEKWGDNELWVAVEARNAPAISMYQKLAFQVKVNEEDQINRSMRRPPRLFMRRMAASDSAGGSTS